MAEQPNRVKGPRSYPAYLDSIYKLFAGVPAKGRGQVCNLVTSLGKAPRQVAEVEVSSCSLGVGPVPAGQEAESQNASAEKVGLLSLARM